MGQVVYHRLAARELREAIKWYAARSDDARARFRQAVRDAVSRILANPQIHAIIADPCRWVRVRRFPYTLIYETRDDGQILIVAVAHGSRRPGYWRRRI